MTKYGNLRLLVDYIKTSQKEEFDIVISISGRERIGKSCLAIHLMKLLIKDFNLQTNISYKTKEIMEKFNQLERESGLIIDEGSDALYRRDFMRTLNKKLIKLFKKIGFKKYAIIINTPNFWAIDTEIRENRVFFWIHVFGRGKAYLFKRSDSGFDEGDVWRKKESQKIIKGIYKSTLDGEEIIEDAYGRVFTSIGAFRFPDFDDKIKKEYEKISEAKKLEDDDDEEIDKWKLRTLKIVYKLKHFDQGEPMNNEEIAKVWLDGKISGMSIGRWIEEYERLSNDNTNN